jgi:hypothetical protein
LQARGFKILMFCLKMFLTASIDFTSPTLWIGPAINFAAWHL